MSQISGPSGGGGGGGTVTSILFNGGLTATPDPVTTTGTATINQTNLTVLDGTVYWDTGTQLLNTTSTGNIGDILTSQGAGMPPIYSPPATSGTITTLHSQDGHNVTPTAGVINISGGNNLTTTGTVGPNTLTVSLTGITQHSLQVGGAANALTQLGVAGNGFLPIGSVGADPVLATLTAGTNISITNAAGSISIASTGAVADSFPTDSGTAVPSGGVLNIISGNSSVPTPSAAGCGKTVQFTGSGNTVELYVTDANANTCIGFQAGTSSNFGNTSLGDQAGQGFGQNNNVAIGTQAILNGASGANNVAVGGLALGYSSGYNECTAIGTNALCRSSGNNNTALGYNAGFNNAFNITGTNNIFLGVNSGSNYQTTESNNILINNTGVAAESGVTRIGTRGTQTSTFITGIEGVSVSNLQLVTINSATDQLGSHAPTGLTTTWSTITANQTAAVSNGYFINKAGTLALLLPATSAVGDIFEVVNINTATGTEITQAAGQQIFIGNTSTTSGTGGSLTSTALGDTLRLVSSAANVWRVTSMIGNWSVV